MADFWKSARTAEPFTYGTPKKGKDEGPSQKEIANVLKNKVSVYRTRANNIVAEEGSPLHTWKKDVLLKADEYLAYIANPELPGADNANVDVFLNESQTELNKILEQHGGSYDVAGKAPVGDIKEFFQQESENRNKNEAIKYKEEIFDNLSEEDKTKIVRQNVDFQKVIDRGVLENYNIYVSEIRKQFEREDNLIKSDPVIAGNLKRITDQLKKYDASILWGRFKSQNPDTAKYKASMKEEMGLTPILEMDDKAQKEYANLIDSYKKIIKDATGFDVDWLPMPMSFKEIPGKPGTSKPGEAGMYLAFGTSDPSAVEWSLTQLKDRNELIEYAGANHISKNIEDATGLNINQFNTAIDSIIANPEKYHPEFVSSLKDVNDTIDFLLKQLDIDLNDLTYQKREFLTEVPVPSKDSMDPTAAQIAPFVEE